MSLDQFLRDKLRMYPHQELCKRQILAAIAVYKDLRPSTEKFVHNDGRQTELFILEGTIPVNFRGTTYNIPICIFLQETHPFIPPMIYVRPTAGMAIKVSKHVDNSGRVFLPYLSEWNHPQSDLTSLIQILCCIFAEEPPVYSKPTGYNQPPQTGYQPPPQYGRGYPPTSTTTPYPTGNQHHRMPSPMSMPMPDPGLRHPGYQAPYPPSTTSSHPFPSPQMPYSSPGGGYPPVSQATPPVSSASQRTSQNVLQSQNSTGISDDHIKSSLMSAVEDKLRRSLKATIEQAQTELDELNGTQQQLKQGSEKLQEMIRRLEKEQSDVENNIKVLTQKNGEISEVITKLEGESEKLNIDDAVVTTAPLYNQILNLFAEENAVEDTIYYLSEALRKEAISSEAFLKQIRTLSRKQFMLRALLYKARKTAGLSDLAG